MQIGLVISACTTLSLWLCYKLLNKQGSNLAKIYGFACENWAFSLCIAELLILSFHSFSVYNNVAQPGWLYIAATGVTLTAIIIRTNNKSCIALFYGIGWCLESLITEALAFGESSTIRIAIANIGLGLASCPIFRGMVAEKK
ncbi:hypothetical protein RintRC_5949 [Richelia intracellularis]|nr:hypothetical protein RintRC_5949 [Richelia intracellularis]